MIEDLIIDFSIGLIVVSVVFGVAVLIAWVVEVRNSFRRSQRPTHRNAPIKTVRRSY